MSAIRRNVGRIVGGIGLLTAILVVVGLALGGRSEPSQSASSSVTVDYRCSVDGGLMTATGTVRNLRSEPTSVRLVWLARSIEGFDPPIERGYTVALEPRQERNFEHPIVSTASITNNVVVDEDYNCFLTVE